MKIRGWIGGFDKREVKERLYGCTGQENWEEINWADFKYALTEMEIEVEADTDTGKVKILSVQNDGLIYRPVERTKPEAGCYPTFNALYPGNNIPTRQQCLEYIERTL